MTSDVIHMGKIKNDGILYAPKQALQSVIDDIGKHGALKKGKKLIVVCVDDTEDNFQVSWYQCGMKMSECVTLCEVAKSRFLEQMEY